MKDRASKIFGLLLFIVLAGVIVSLGVSAPEIKDKINYSGIEINGFKMLSENAYLSFTGLSDSASLKDVTLSDVKVRFEKHPYIFKADVEFDGSNKIIVELKERNFKAVVFENQKFKLLTENYEFVPVFSNTDFYELPIITNLNPKRKNAEDVSEANIDLIQALKIIDGIKFCNEEMYSNLAEINLHRGGDVILTFSRLKCPVIFGRGNEAKKILTLKEIWHEIQSTENIYSNIEYVDLRFNKQILIGKKVKTEAEG